MPEVTSFVNVDGGFAVVDLPAKMYPLETVYGAAFLFLDRAYIRLEEGPGKAVRVLLKSQDDTDEKGLEDLAGTFCNELVNQAIRTEVSKSNQKLREYIVAKALFSAEDSEDDFMDLLGDDDADTEMVDDPLGIATPWEEKYGASKPAGETVGGESAG